MGDRTMVPTMAPLLGRSKITAFLLFYFSCVAPQFSSAWTTCPNSPVAGRPSYQQSAGFRESIPSLPFSAVSIIHHHQQQQKQSSFVKQRRKRASQVLWAVQKQVDGGANWKSRASTKRAAVAVVDTDAAASNDNVSLTTDSDEDDNVVSNANELDVASAIVMAGSDLTEIGDNKKTWSKIVNGLFLTLCFGYAIGSLLNIDQGMTRGWTQSEIALRIPVDAWSNYELALEESPVATKTMINVIIYLLGDWLSQTVFAKQHILDFDLGRTVRNGFIGLCFGPLVHEYYQFSDSILPVEGGLGNRLCKILMDQTIYLGVKCSIYIFFLNTLQGQDFDTSTRAVKDKIGGIVVTAWKFWPLIHCITYSVIPARHRILWVNCVDLVWNAILASMSQQQQQTPPETDNVDGELEESALPADSAIAVKEDTVQPVIAIALRSGDDSRDHDVVTSNYSQAAAVDSSHVGNTQRPASEMI